MHYVLVSTQAFLRRSIGYLLIMVHTCFSRIHGYTELTVDIIPSSPALLLLHQPLLPDIWNLVPRSVGACLRTLLLLSIGANPLSTIASSGWAGVLESYPVILAPEQEAQYILHRYW